jgi:hypothetical protein
MALGSTHPLRKCVSEILPVDKGGRYLRLTILPYSLAYCLEIWVLQTLGYLRACARIALPYSAFISAHSCPRIH